MSGACEVDRPESGRALASAAEFGRKRPCGLAEECKSPRRARRRWSAGLQSVKRRLTPACEVLGHGTTCEHGRRDVANPTEVTSCAGVTFTNWRLARLWLDALAAERGAVPGTLDTYGDDLACYLGWLADPNGGAGLALADVRREDIARYLAHLDRAHGYAEATVGHRRSVVRSLHRFLISEDLASHDPLLEVAPMKRLRRLPYTPTRGRGRPAARDGARPSGDASVGALPPGRLRPSCGSLRGALRFRHAGERGRRPARLQHRSENANPGDPRQGQQAAARARCTTGPSEP